MFCLNTTLLNIRRHKQKSALVVLICLLIVFFVSVYICSIITNQRQYDNLPNTLPVTARVENHAGSQIVGLTIREELLNNIKYSGYAKDLYYSVQMAATFSSLPGENGDFNSIAICGVNDIESVPNYKDKNIKLKSMVDIRFLHGSDAMCIADETFMRKNDLSVGDSVEIDLYGLNYDSSDETFVYVPFGSCSLLIVGSMSPSISGDDTSIMDLLCPVGWAKEKHMEAGASFYLDSARFTVSDPMNLSAFKAAMKESFLLPVDPLAEQSIVGDSLSVQDETFIKTATRLKKSLTVLYTFAPIVFIVIALVGYAVSYLLMQSRRTDIVIMRSLGTSRAKCVAVFFLEYAALGLFGAILGLGLSVMFMGYAGFGSLLAALLFFLSFLVGIVGAAFHLSRRTAMSGLVKVEA